LTGYLDLFLDCLGIFSQSFDADVEIIASDGLIGDDFIDG